MASSAKTPLLGVKEPLGAGKVQDDLTLGDLFVDRRIAKRAVKFGLPAAKAKGYQRDITPRAEKIAEKFDPEMFERPVVNKRPNGVYAVVDGGNRLAALRIMGASDDTPISCIVFQYDPKHEPLHFARLNTERTPVNGVDVFLAEVDSGDTTASAIQRILKAHGLRIGYPNGSPAIKAVVTVKGAFSLGILSDVAYVAAPWAEFTKGVEAAQLGCVMRLLTEWEGWTLENLRAIASEESPVRLYEKAYAVRKRDADAGMTTRPQLIGHTLSPYMAELMAKKYRSTFGTLSMRKKRKPLSTRSAATRAIADAA